MWLMALSWLGLLLLAISVGGLNVVVLVQEENPLEDALRSVLLLASEHTGEGTGSAAGGESIAVDVVTTTQGLAAVQDLCLALDQVDNTATTVAVRNGPLVDCCGKKT